MFILSYVKTGLEIYGVKFDEKFEMSYGIVGGFKTIEEAREELNDYYEGMLDDEFFTHHERTKDDFVFWHDEHHYYKMKIEWLEVRRCDWDV